MSWRTCRWGILMACAIVHGRWRNGGARRLEMDSYPRLILQIEMCRPCFFCPLFSTRSPSWVLRLFVVHGDRKLKK